MTSYATKPAAHASTSDGAAHNAVAIDGGTNVHVRAHIERALERAVAHRSGEGDWSDGAIRTNPMLPTRRKRYQRNRDASTVAVSLVWRSRL